MNSSANDAPRAINFVVFLLSSRRGAVFAACALLAVVGLLWQASVHDSLRGRAATPFAVSRAIHRDSWMPFLSRDRSSDTPAAALSFVQPWSYSCTDRWIAKGELCEQLSAQGSVLKDYRAAFGWTWINGSDALLKEWREDAEQIQLARSRTRKSRFISTIHHFRDHNELLYSMRSVAAAFPPGSQLPSFHLFASDLPHGLAPASLHSGFSASTSVSPVHLERHRIGQIPTWLDQARESSLDLQMQFHSNLFRSNASLPSFNSLAIESQIPNMQSDVDHLVYFNDDFFLTGPVTASHFGSPLTGPVLLFQLDLRVGGETRPFAGDAQGEWKGLGRSALLLDRRFGRRYRPYIAHVMRAVSLAVSREASLSWASEFETTAATRLRGHGEEITPFFLFSHYLVEKSRELLLWSFVVARADRNRDGFLDASERIHLLRELGLSQSSLYFSSRFPLRRTKATDPTHPAYSPRFTSSEGYAFGSSTSFPLFDATDLDLVHNTTAKELVDRRQTECRQSVITCFGETFSTDLELSSFSSVDVFKRIAFEYPSCGDCIIMLIKAEGDTVAGLGDFLPEVDVVHDGGGDDDERAGERQWKVFPVGDSWRTLDFTLPALPGFYTHASLQYATELRRYVVALLQRYSYSVGDATSYLATMTNAPQVVRMLSSIDQQFAIDSQKAYLFKEEVQVLGLNDDIVSPASNVAITRVLDRYFTMKWGQIRLSFEKQTTVEE